MNKLVDRDRELPANKRDLTQRTGFGGIVDTSSSYF